MAAFCHPLATWRASASCVPIKASHHYYRSTRSRSRSVSGLQEARCVIRVSRRLCSFRPHQLTLQATVVPEISGAVDSWTGSSPQADPGMVTLLHLSSWVVGLLAAAGVGLGLALLLFPELKQWPADFVQQHLFPDANQITLKTAKANGEQRDVYRILAFGDSLTEGFTSGGINFHPYVKRLGDSIYAQMPQDWHLEVEEQGESGERVLISMKHRLQRTLDEHQAAGRSYDWVLLLGGINDLAGDQSTADEVLQGLSVLTEACLQHGANVLLMTVMEVAQPEPRVEQQRLKLNSLIQQYVQGGTWAAAAQEAASNSSSNTPVSRRGVPRVVLFDLAQKLTWNQMDEETRWQMWDDGVHLTIDGYDLMGDLIVEALSPLVKQDIGAAAAAAGKAAASEAAAEQNGVATDKKGL